MSLVDTFKIQIEKYWDHLQADDPYTREILEGTATQEMVSHFLVNIRYLVQHTPIHLNRAIEASYASGNEKLLAFFKLKYKEELGHDKWADSDLAKLNTNKQACISATSNIDTSMLTYVNHIESMIAFDPHYYLGYIFFPEYLCVIAGPQLAEALEKKCGFPPDSMTVISNHAELDKSHVHEWTHVIRDIIDEEQYQNALLESLKRTIVLHEQFLKSCQRKRSHEAA